MNRSRLRGPVYVDPVPRVAVAAPDLLEDPAGVRAVAQAFAAGLRRGPLWLVVGPARPLAARRGREEAMRHLADDAAWEPGTGGAPGPETVSTPEATARVLERRLAADGLRPPRAGAGDAARMPRVACALVPAPDPWGTALDLAAAMDGPLHVWSRDATAPALRAAARRRGVALVVKGLEGVEAVLSGSTGGL